MKKPDPVLQQIAAYPWLCGGVQARQSQSGIPLISIRTGARRPAEAAAG
jgi:hypothetical protein